MARNKSRACEYGFQEYNFQGHGIYPATDMHGRALDGKRLSLAGSRICGGYTVVLDGLAMDQEFVSKVFNLQRFILSLL